MITDSNTVGIFPTPITTLKHISVTEGLLDFVRNLEFIPAHKNNSTLSMTKENYVLNTFEELKEIKEKILEIANYYWRDVIAVDQSLVPMMKHSWITRHKKGEFNPPHIHTTSLFSIVTYLQTDNNCGNLVFKKNEHYLNLFPSVVDLDFSSKNLINEKIHSVIPETNLSVCFPSHLNHYTESNSSEKERYSLNVDFWVNGITRKNSNFPSVF